AAPTPGVRSAPGTVSSRAAGRPTPRWLLAAAAAAVVALAVPSSIAWQQHERAVVAEQRSAELTELLAAPGTEVLRGDVEGGGTAVAVLAADAAVLVTEGLPTLDGGRTYQLWAMRDGVPVPAGLFEPASGSAQVTAADYRPGDGLAVSVEPAGGSAQPTTTPVVVLLPS
ncbi:anti-sigma factor, partial [Actinotalea sp. JY-7885]